MVTYNSKSVCEEARLYYYDFLSDESHEQIPDFIISHLECCYHCQNEIEQFKRLLSEDRGSIDTRQKQVDSSIIAMMKLHFAYVGQSVTCTVVKHFLTSM